MSNEVEMKTSDTLIFERARSAVLRSEFVELFGASWSVYSAENDRGNIKIRLLEVKPIVFPS